MGKRMNLQLLAINIDSKTAEKIDNALTIRANLNFSEDFQFPLQDPIYTLMSMHSAWYSGDPNLIHETYKSMVGKVGGSAKSSFWTKKEEDGIVKLHVPIASDIASTSADMLFAELPEITIPEAEKNNRDGVVAQERLDEIVEESGLANRLLEAAETCAAIGGVYLVPTWDLSIANHPILAINQADNAIPEFKWGYLYAVTFYRVVYEDNDVTYRHLERHESGKILNGLFRGTRHKLGRQVPLSELPATRGLMEEIPTGWNKLMARYIPNMKPNRRFRGSPHGQSDFAGIEPLMDSLDEVYSSWMRDIRLARARIIVPETYLDFEDRDGKKSPYFDVDKAIYTALSMDPIAAKEHSITLHQFDIRAEEHKNSAYELLERIITHAGYSPQTFGLQMEGRADTGTALNIRERKTYITRQKKWKYWKNALEDVLEMMLHIDSYILKNPTPVLRPTLKLTDSMSRDLASLATSLQALNNAQAVSIDTRVRLLHPDWSEEQIEKEIERIKEEQGIGKEPELPDPLAPTNIDDMDDMGDDIDIAEVGEA